MGDVERGFGEGWKPGRFADLGQDKNRTKKEDAQLSAPKSAFTWQSLGLGVKDLTAYIPHPIPSQIGQEEQKGACVVKCDSTSYWKQSRKEAERSDLT